MPRPTVEPGAVLVRVNYSLVSVGTEIAALLPTGDPNAAAIDKTKAYASLAWTYLGKAARNPHMAAARLSEIARRYLADVAPRPAAHSAPTDAPTTLTPQWERSAATELSGRNGSLSFVTDPSPSLYQVISLPIAVPAGHALSVDIEGTLEGPLALGVLDAGRKNWVGNIALNAGRIDDHFSFDVGGSAEVTLVFSNANAGRALRATLNNVTVGLQPPTADDLPASEMGDTGWTLGYSIAGEIVETGSAVKDLKVGDRVACAGAGKANHADFVVVPRNLVVRVPSGCSAKSAASATVGSIALQGVRRTNPQLGDCVCVIGLGLIGQIVVQLLKANGCTVIGFDPDPARVKRAVEHGLDAGAETPDSLKALLRDRSDGRGADRTLITAATKSDAPINLAMEATRAKGTVVIVGDVGLAVDRAQFYRKEIDLLMSTSYGPGRYDRAYEEEGRDYPAAYVRWTLNRNMALYLDLIARGKVDFESLIDAVVPVSEAPQAYRALAAAGTDKPLGVLIHYPEPPEAAEFAAKQLHLRGHAKPARGTLHYCLVGAGGFGTAMLVPQMAKRRDRFFLRGVVSRDPARGGAFARANRVEVLATDLDSVLKDAGFDLMVIATRHHEHAAQAIACLNAGKHVFVEKPLAITWEELDRVVSAYERIAKPPMLMVGFNRRFSPALEKLRDALRSRRSPLMVNYRLNGGYIPPDHWVQGPEGGGRNIGEACHMYDVFRSLAGAPVASIAARAIDPHDLPHLANNNFAATLGYDDGSVCNLVYTALGPKQGLPKERIEVFCDGEAWVVDDFRRLLRAGDGAVLWEGDTDKGHFEELSRFGDALAEGQPSPIPFAEIVETTAVALHIEDLLRQGGGTLAPEAGTGQR